MVVQKKAFSEATLEADQSLRIVPNVVSKECDKDAEKGGLNNLTLIRKVLSTGVVLIWIGLNTEI